MIENDRQLEATYQAAYRGTPAFWRDVLEGRSHVLQNTGLFNLKIENVALPALTGKSPAVQALLQESRKFLGHPYDDNWWEAAVKQFIKQHSPQMLSEIEARNAGYLLFRAEGEDGGHH